MALHRNILRSLSTSPQFFFKGIKPAVGAPLNHVLEQKHDFQADIHLAIEPPEFGYDTAFERVRIAESRRPIVMTEPFRVLSDKGIAIFQSILEDNKSEVKTIQRSTTLRGLGFRSSFVLDFTFSQPVLDVLSGFAREVGAIQFLFYASRCTNTLDVISHNEMVLTAHLAALPYKQCCAHQLCAGWTRCASARNVAP